MNQTRASLDASRWFPSPLARPITRTTEGTI
jgi:hypothetical protein